MFADRDVEDKRPEGMSKRLAKSLLQQMHPARISIVS